MCIRSPPSPNRPSRTGTSACTGLCAARQPTLRVHVRAVKYASALLLITNLVLVALVLALRSDRLWRRRVVAVRHRAAMTW
jgi:hypothetical protein